MKKKLIYTALFSFAFFQASAQVVNIPDANFKAAIIESRVDKNANGEIELSEAQAAKEIGVFYTSVNDYTGLEAFSNIELFAMFNNEAKSKLDLSNNIKLKTLEIFGSSLTEINISKNINLESIRLESPTLTQLDISKNVALKSLYLEFLPIKQLEISKNTILKSLSLVALPNLTYMNLPSSISEITINECKFGSIDLSNCVNLKVLNIQNNTFIKILDLSKNINVEYLNLYYCTQLSNIDISKNDKLKGLDLIKTNIKYLNITGLKILETLSIINNASLVQICARPNQIENLIGESFGNPLSTVDTNCTSNTIPSDNIIKDLGFRDYLIQIGLDVNNDGGIQKEEVQSITNLDVDSKNIYSLEGIQYFTELTILNCSNNFLKSLDLFGNTKLVKVFCHSNKLSSFKISKYKNSTLRTLVISNNELAGTLNLRTSTYLDKLWCYNNQLSNICVANVSKAETSPNYRKDVAASFTNNCGWVAREGDMEVEAEFFAETNIYPNPTKGTLFVRTNEPVIRLIVKNLNGTQLLESQGSSQMDIAQLAAGVYVVDIVTANGIETRKLVVE